MRWHPAKRQCVGAWHEEDAVVNKVLHGREWIHVWAIVASMHVGHVLEPSIRICLLKNVHPESLEVLKRPCVMLVFEDWFDIV